MFHSTLRFPKRNNAALTVTDQDPEEEESITRMRMMRSKLM